MTTKFSLAQRFIQEYPQIATSPDQFGIKRLSTSYSVQEGTVYHGGKVAGTLYKRGKYVASYDPTKDKVYK